MNLSFLRNEKLFHYLKLLFNFRDLNTVRDSLYSITDQKKRKEKEIKRFKRGYALGKYFYIRQRKKYPQSKKSNQKVVLVEKPYRVLNHVG